MSRLTYSSRSVGSLICFAATFALFAVTLAPTVQGFDSAELTVGAYALGFVHAPGYPLYMLLGHLFGKLPLGDVGRQINLMSALFGSLAVLGLFAVLSEDSDDLTSTLPAVLLFATIPSFWSQALRAEVYTLQVFLMVTALYLWRRAHRSGQSRWIVGCYLVLGVGMGNHLSTLLLWASMLICLIWETPHLRRMTGLGTASGVVAAGVLYLYFPLRSLQHPMADYVGPYFGTDLSTLKGLWWLATARMFQHEAYWTGSVLQTARELFHFGTNLWVSFLGVGALLGVLGWWRLRKEEALWNRLLTVYLVSNALAFSLYHVVDKEVMFVPVYAAWCVWMARGLREVAYWLHHQSQQLSELGSRLSVGTAVLLVAVAGVATNWNGVSLHNDRRAYNFAGELLREVEPEALVVNGWATASVLDYLRLVEGWRPDVRSFNLDFYNLAALLRYGSLNSADARAEWSAWLARELQTRPLCFIEPLPAVPEHYGWARQGMCCKLVLRAGK